MNSIRPIASILTLLMATATGCGSGSTEPAQPNSTTVPSSGPENEDVNANTEAAGDGTQSDEAPGEPAPSAEGASTIAQAINRFGFDLYAAIREGSDENLALSPASIELALAMTRGGAAAETAAEMDRVLHLAAGESSHRAANQLLGTWNDPDRESYELRIVNRLFGESSFSFDSDFLALTRDQYGAELEPVSYRTDPDGSRVRINDWVAGQTNNRIRDLIPPGNIDRDTTLTLTNAIYFLGRWRSAFDPERTTPAAFWAEGSREVSVPTMWQTGRFSYAELPGVKAISLPYTGDELAMTVLLPEARDGLSALEASLDADALAGIDDAMQETNVVVRLPRFRVDPARPIQLGTVLERMGMPRAFSAAAEFEPMVGAADQETRLRIGDVFHKAFVDVNEEGTEAAAATAVVMTRGTGAAPPQVQVDHPFLFLIRDTRNGAILFLGRIVDPTT